MLKIGHRGAAGYEPENTLRSFKKAMALGVDMIELDVHLCKSGEVVVIHDDTLERTTNGFGYVAQKTLAELNDLDAGAGDRIPTLPEVLELVNRRAKVNIELKGRGTAEAVAGLIAQYIRIADWKYEDFLVSSFSRKELRILRNIDSRVLLGMLLENFSLGDIGFWRFAEEISAHSVHIPLGLANQRLVDLIHLENRTALVWVVNKPVDILYVKSLGVDGIFSDYPDRL